MRRRRASSARRSVAVRLGGVFLLRPFSRRVDESPHVPMTLFPGQVLHSIGIAACHRAKVKKSGASVDTDYSPRQT